MCFCGKAYKTDVDLQKHVDKCDCVYRCDCGEIMLDQMAHGHEETCPDIRRKVSQDNNNITQFLLKHSNGD